jgi:Protein of unknown function (DUF1579)
MKKIMLMAAASIVSAFCFGQTPDMAAPVEMKKFDWMVGEWTTKSKWTMPGMEPMDVASSFKAEWDGQFLKQVASSEFVGFMKMTETMMLGYDASKGEYVSYAFTNFAPTPRIEHGKLTGDVLVMVCDSWDVMGSVSTSRSTLTKLSNDEAKFKLEFKEGDKWSVVTEGVYKRVKK